MEEKMKTLMTKIDGELHKNLKLLAAVQGKSMERIIRKLIGNYVEKNQVILSNQKTMIKEIKT